MAVDIRKYANIETLLDPENIRSLQKASEVIGQALNSIAALGRKNESDSAKIYKAGTTFIAAVLLKIKGGKNPGELTADDWKDIADHVSEYAVKADDRTYSAYVFSFCAWFIRKSAEAIAEISSEEKASAVLALSEEIRTKTEQLELGEIGEAKYIDDCLWICLEAMIKLTCIGLGMCVRPDKKQLLKPEEERLLEAAMIFGMEYSRMLLYKKEHALLTEYLEHQKVLDGELAEQYEQYIEELTRETARFGTYIDNAFDPGLRDRLRSSAELAMAAGVAEDEVLKTMQDVDDYFM